MEDKATCGRKRTALLNHIMENRNYVQVKELASHRTAWIQELTESMS